MIFGIASFLSGCGSEQKKPKTVIKHFKSAFSEIESGSFSGNLTLEGKQETDSTHLQADLKGKYNYKKGDEQKYALHATVAGKIEKEGTPLDGTVDLDLLSLGKNIYFNVNQLEVNDLQFSKLEPRITPYTKKWLQLDPGLLSQNPVTPDKDVNSYREKWQKIFRESNLFTVKKEFGIENMNGNNVYHYGIEIDPVGVANYVKAVATMVNAEEVDANAESELLASLEKVVPALNAAANPEIWIGTKDYYLYKISFELNSSLVPDFPKESGDVLLKVVFTGGDYNTSINIDAPKESELFNPLAILFGAAAMNPGGLNPSEVMPQFDAIPQP